MDSSATLCKLVFWFVTGSLIGFLLLFGLPFVSTFAAGKVVAYAGCTAPSFDMQAVCPSGSFAEKFVPLSQWFTSGLAPLVLLINFGEWIVAWAGLSMAIGVACRLLARD